MELFLDVDSSRLWTGKKCVKAEEIETSPALVSLNCECVVGFGENQAFPAKSALAEIKREDSFFAVKAGSDGKKVLVLHISLKAGSDEKRCMLVQRSLKS